MELIQISCGKNFSPWFRMRSKNQAGPIFNQVNCRLQPHPETVWHPVVEEEIGKSSDASQAWRFILHAINY